MWACDRAADEEPANGGELDCALSARYATARYAVKEAREAIWARRVALFFVQLMILTVLLHRFASLATPAALNLIGVSIAGLLDRHRHRRRRDRAHLVRRPDRRGPGLCRHLHRLSRPGRAGVLSLESRSAAAADRGRDHAGGAARLQDARRPAPGRRQPHQGAGRGRRSRPRSRPIPISGRW